MLDVDCKRDTFTNLLEHGRFNRGDSFSTNALWTEEEFVRTLRKTIHSPEINPSSNLSPSMAWKCVPWLTRGLHRLFHSLTSPAAKQLLCGSVISGCIHIIPPVTDPWEPNSKRGKVLANGDHESNMIKQAKFMNMLSSQFERLPRWCTALIKTDLSLPSDDEMDHDEELPTAHHWVVGLVQTATAMLSLCEPPSLAKTLQPAALSLAIHALIRSTLKDSPSRERLLYSLLRSSSKLCLSDLKQPARGDHIFYPLFSTLPFEPPYFHSALMEYHDCLMGLQSKSHGSAFVSFRALFLRSAISFIRVRTEERENGADEDFFVHDEDLAELEEMLSDAETAVQGFAHQALAVACSNPSPSVPFRNPSDRIALKRGLRSNTTNQPPAVRSSTSTLTAPNRKRKLEVYVEIPRLHYASGQCVSLPSSPACSSRKRPRTDARIIPGLQAPKLLTGRGQYTSNTKTPPQAKNNDVQVHHPQNTPNSPTREQMEELTSTNGPTGTILGLPFPPPLLTSILLAHIPNASNSLSAGDSESGQRRDLSICTTMEMTPRKSASCMARTVRQPGLVSEPNYPSRNQGPKPENTAVGFWKRRHRPLCDETVVPSPSSRSDSEPHASRSGLRQDDTDHLTSASRVRPLPTQKCNPPPNRLSHQGAAIHLRSNEYDPPNLVRCTRAESMRKTNVANAQPPHSSEHDPLDLFHTPGSALRPKARRPTLACVGGSKGEHVTLGTGLKVGRLHARS